MATPTAHPWKPTFYACFAAQTLAIMGFTTATSFMPFYLRELGVTGEADVARWSGRVMAAAPISMFFFTLIWGSLADRFGRRRMVIRSMFGGTLVIALMGFVQTPHQLLACRLLQGALTGTITAMLALVASAAPRARAGYALGMMHAAVAFGFAVGPMVGGHLAPLVTYRGTFLVASFFLCFGGCLVLLFARENFRPQPRTEKAQRASYWDVLTSRGFFAAAFALFTLRFANSVARPTFALFIEQIHGKSASVSVAVGNILGMGGFAAALGAFYFGRRIERIGRRRLLLFSCLFTALGSFAYPLMGTATAVLLLRIVISFGAAGMRPSGNAIIRHATDDANMGKAYGLAASLGAIGWGLGSLSGSELSARMGLNAPFILMGLLLLVACGLILRSIPPDHDGADSAKPAP